MNPRGKVARKAFEAFRDAKAYYMELERERQAIQYHRNNVKGVNYEPHLGGSGSGETLALIMGERMDTVIHEMYRLQILLDFVNVTLDELETEDESLLRERYVEGLTIETMALARGISRDQVKYKIESVFARL